ncbi:MAG TPA: ABC transporter ATP-binding protein [bacterium]|nr:ABC transporter ATP-binding protein [bacterium]
MSAAGSAPLLTAVGLAMTYRRKHTDIPVLHGVNLALHAGEELLIVGASGTGKTTLLNLLSGLERPTAGTVSYRGQVLATLSDRERSRLRAEQLGFVFQLHHLLGEFSALENVMLPALAAGMTRAAARARAAELLDRVGLSRRGEHFPAQLSGGESQRVAVARALVNRPALVMADEPTGNLDWASGHQVIDLLRELVRERQGAFLLVSHDDRLCRELPVRRLAAGILQPPAESPAGTGAGPVAGCGGGPDVQAAAGSACGGGATDGGKGTA